MESRTRPAVARRLAAIVVLLVFAKSGWQRWQTIAVLLVVLGLSFQVRSTDGATVCPAGCTCQPSGELASCVGLTHVPRFFGHSPKVLRITQHRITKVTSKSFRGLERLEELEITDGRLFEISHDAFSSLRHLKNVNLSRNELAVLPRDSLAACSQLQQLDLSWNPLVLPGRGAMLASKSLSALDLSFCSLSKLPDQTFSMLPALSELRLRGNSLQRVSECVLEPVKELILLDADLQWVACASLDATTSGILQMEGRGDHEVGPVAPTDHFFGYTQIAFVPTLAQLIFLIVAALVVVLLLACIRKVCKPKERRKDHMYEILGGIQAAQLPIHPYIDFRTSRISTNTCDTFTDSASVSMGDGESRQYLPHYFPALPALKP